MKIGILTLPLHTNYGGILQAYALQTVLERMGHEVIVFDSPNHLKVSVWKYPLIIAKRCISRFLLRRPVKIFYERWYNNMIPIVRQYTQPFIDKNIHRFEISSFSSISSNFVDVFVVGSDQVWRPKYFSPMYAANIEEAFLNFSKGWNVKRFSYAASFGTEEWEYTEAQTKKCGELLKMFDCVTVREESGVFLCEKYFGVNAHHVLDPTMLLDSSDYMALVRQTVTPKSPGNLLCYILDESEKKETIISQVAKDKGLIPFFVNSKIEDNIADIQERIHPPVESWLQGFHDADFVVTDSFHACVFSILFRKPFLVIGNKKRGNARFESLLKLFGLQNRLLDEFEPCYELDDINWSFVYKILDEKREIALSFMSVVFDK